MRQLDACDFCGDAPEGVFEVVPASVADGPVRLALCADCRSTLQAVVNPLLDADESAEQSADESPEQSAELSDGQPADQSRDSSTAAETDGDGVTIQPSDAPEADRSASDTGDQPASNTGDRAGSDTDDQAAADEDRSAGGSPARRPDGYAQVIRLLQNREGAMPREDLRALATNAYDLRQPAFEDAVDAAIENGDVEETAGGLRTT